MGSRKDLSLLYDLRRRACSGLPRIWQVCHKHNYSCPVAADGPLPAERREMIHVTPAVAGATPVA